MIKCPKCGGTDFERSHRRGIVDHLLARTGYWPYRCQECAARFRLRFRAYLPPKPEWKPEPRTDEAAPHMASRRHPARPIAKVVIAADSHEKLDQILLTLGKVVAQSNQASRTYQNDTANRR